MTLWFEIPILKKHVYSMGNGTAIKSSAKEAKGGIVFMDGDDQHSPSAILRMLERYKQGFDMVVGGRSNELQASFTRFAGNKSYNKLVSMVVGKKIEDLTSGFRMVNGKKFLRFLYYVAKWVFLSDNDNDELFQGGLFVYRCR